MSSVLEATETDLTPVTVVPSPRRRRWPAAISVRPSVEQTSSRIEEVADVLYGRGTLDDGQQQIAFAAMRLAHAQQAGNMLAGNDVLASDNTAVDDDPYLQPVVNPEFAAYSGRFGPRPACTTGYRRRFDDYDRVRLLLVSSNPTNPAEERALTDIVEDTMRTKDLGNSQAAAPSVTEIISEALPGDDAAATNTESADKSVAATTEEAAGS